MKKKKLGWGGKRPGAGRPKGTGQGSSPDSRRNRVAVMLRDVELKKVKALARKRGLPVATVVYELAKSQLDRTRA